MANPWYKTATGKAALAGVIPTTLVSLIAIGVQTCLTYKQFGLNASKDKNDSIRTEEKDRNDSIREYEKDKQDSIRILKADRQDSLHALQQYSYDSILNARLIHISKSQLAITEGQYLIQEKAVAAKELNDLMKFEAASNKLAALSNTRSPIDSINFKGAKSWSTDVMDVLISQLDNPILVENKTVFKQWTDYIGAMRYQQWIFELLKDQETRQRLIKEEESKGKTNEVINRVGVLASRSYSYYAIRLDQYLSKTDLDK